MRNTGLVALLAEAMLCAACDVDDGRVCSTELRVAVNGSVFDAAGALVRAESISARVNGGDPRACSWSYGTYSCMEQGGGRYEVTVNYPTESLTQAVDVKADDCHVLRSSSLDFTLPVAQEPGCGERLAPIAEVDLNGISYDELYVTKQQLAAPFPAVEGKLQIYAPPGLAAEVEQTLVLTFDSGIQCAMLTFVPRPENCGYENVTVQVKREDIQLCAKSRIGQ